MQAATFKRPTFPAYSPALPVPATAQDRGSETPAASPPGLGALAVTAGPRAATAPFKPLAGTGRASSLPGAPGLPPRTSQAPPQRPGGGAGSAGGPRQEEQLVIQTQQQQQLPPLARSQAMTALRQPATAPSGRAGAESDPFSELNKMIHGQMNQIRTLQMALGVEAGKQEQLANELANAHARTQDALAQVSAEHDDAARLNVQVEADAKELKLRKEQLGKAEEQRMQLMADNGTLRREFASAKKEFARQLSHSSRQLLLLQNVSLDVLGSEPPLPLKSPEPVATAAAETPAPSQEAVAPAPDQTGVDALALARQADECRRLQARVDELETQLGAACAARDQCMTRAQQVHEQVADYESQWKFIGPVIESCPSCMAACSEIAAQREQQQMDAGSMLEAQEVGV
jgi:hypothetical protein